ncbi:DsbA family oxidoreductase [Leucobacter sp. M11]|uniref:DsbA family oxidoreductase n=1 Tax=Leucobacter sp. M11 TaxID=2993565 RepID=UPI002D7FFD62|nr:DsbA family oxidoreductase [Leucobacter sp. M11]MEB4613955.1 DsbA family oxidoreductase [Leucobacter sp. M11]
MTQTNPQHTIRVDIWSDIACPWCFIGKRRFEAGVAAFVAQRPDVAVESEYHSFELAPDTPDTFEGSEIDFLVTHKGMPRAKVEEMLAQMTEMAQAEGLAYRFDRVQHVNTLRAHRVLHLAKAQGLQHEAVERLLAAYFEEGRNLASDDELAALGAEVGLAEADVRAALQDPATAEAVQDDITRARMLGISGVPFYLLESKYGVSGAQSPESFVSVFEQVLEREAAEAAAGA